VNSLSRGNRHFPDRHTQTQMGPQKSARRETEQSLPAVWGVFFPMSSIKRDVKKKASPRPESEIFSRDPAHSSFASLEKFVVHSREFPRLMVTMPSSVKQRQAKRLIRLSTTVLSEAHGLWLFLVIREGIT